MLLHAVEICVHSDQDNPDVKEPVSAILKLSGYQVHTHLTGIGVPDVVSKIQPDLILFSANPKAAEAVTMCNADAFIHKPFEIHHLIETINSLVA